MRLSLDHVRESEEVARSGRPFRMGRHPQPRLRDVVRMLGRRERRWLGRRILQDVAADSRPTTVGILALAITVGAWLLPLASGTALGRHGEIVATLAGLGLVLAAITLAWWRRLALDSIVHNLLLLRRCGRCAHPEQDRGPVLMHQGPFACRTWRCVECGTEWAGAGEFAEAETRQDAA